MLLCDSQTRRYMYAEPLKISATCNAFVLLLLIQMPIASSSSDFDRRAQARTQARAELVRFGVPREVWPRHATPHLMHTYLLGMDWLPRIVVLLTVQKFQIPSQYFGTLHSAWFPFGDDAHAAWEACKRRAGWQPSCIDFGILATRTPHLRTRSRLHLWRWLRQLQPAAQG